MCLFAFQINDQGKYEEESFQISPFIWAVGTCIERKELDLLALSLSRLNDLQRSYESYLMREEISVADKISHIYENLKNGICSFISGGQMKDANNGVLIYTMYLKKEDGKIRLSSVRGKNGKYSNLRQSYILDDLNLVNAQLDSGGDIKILNYIDALNEEVAEHRNIKEDLELVRSASNPLLYPLGKWPSRYNPALMQQLAVNIADVNKKWEEPVAQKIFSVNGPPGTGKTTLLKEVIVDNIVKRAIKLADYERPDDAFTECSFSGLYDELTTKYYKPDEVLTAYGMLVASSNNSAVENISKELPKASDVSRDKTRTDLFHVSKDKPSEIYFTDLTQRLYGEDSWGMISVPLGRKENITAFYKEVLSNIIFTNKDEIQTPERNELFQEAKREFRQQLQYVEGLQQKLYEDYIENRRLIQRDQETEYEINEILRHQSDVRVRLEELKIRLESAEQAVSEQRQQSQQNKLRYDEQSRLIDDTRDNIIEWEGKLTFLERLTSWIYRSEKLVRISELREAKEKQNKELDRIGRLLKESDNFLNKLEAESEKCLALYNEQKDQADSLDREYRQVNKKRKDLLQEIESRKKYRQEVGIQGIFEIYSKEELLNEESQKKSYYTYEEYDKAREKLFYDALILHKSFMRASNSIHVNMRTLSKMWAKVQDRDHHEYCFTEEDRTAAFEPIFQSLFLFVPVISTTFASVENLLRYIREPNRIGLLIVDEAGQSNPQLAVGALWRSRKAMVVGDPKQIEPVVTIPECVYSLNSDDFLKRYHRKSVSIQEFADRLNVYSGKVKNRQAGEEVDEWVGCPLIVHRRCIDPMFSISNEIAYNNTMINATEKPSSAKEESFLYRYSDWIQVSGREIGNKNHFVREQGQKVLEMILAAKKKQSQLPDIYIISPFKQVASEMADVLEQSREMQLGTKDEILAEWIDSHCGTVHTFQGKAADEVIFLLGCDQWVPGAVEWVNTNIVNVAVTRAKYRLYVVGDYEVWKDSELFRIVKNKIDEFKRKVIADTAESSRV